MPKIAPSCARGGGSLAEALVKTARCTFRRDGSLDSMMTPFYRRALLPLGQRIAGPAIVLQIDSTTVVPPDATLTADESGNLILLLRG